MSQKKIKFIIPNMTFYRIQKKINTKVVQMKYAHINSKLLEFEMKRTIVFASVFEIYLKENFSYKSKNITFYPLYINFYTSSYFYFYPCHVIYFPLIYLYI